MSGAEIGMLPYYNNYQTALYSQLAGQSYMPYSVWSGTGSSFVGLLQQCLSAQKVNAGEGQTAQSSKGCAVCGCGGEKQAVQNMVDLIQEAYQQASYSHKNKTVSAKSRSSNIYANHEKPTVRSQRNSDTNIGLQAAAYRHHIW